jgi:hypothetical protein
MARLRDGPGGHLAGAPTLNGCYDVTGILGKMVLVITYFLHAKECLRMLSALWIWTLRTSGQLCPELKVFQGYRFEGAPTCVVPALYSAS